MKTVKFSEIEYKRPDMEALKKALEEATAKVLNAKSYEEVRDAYYALQEREQADETMSTLAYVRNTINMKDEFYAQKSNGFRKNLPIPSLSTMLMRRLLHSLNSDRNSRLNLVPSSLERWMLH